MRLVETMGNGKTKAGDNSSVTDTQVRLLVFRLQPQPDQSN